MAPRRWHARRVWLSLGRALGSRHTPRARLALTALSISAVALVTLLLYVADLGYTLYSSQQPGIRMARRYDAAAAAILTGDGILYPRVWPPPWDTGLLSRPPGYPAFVAGVYALLGRDFAQVQVAQAVLGALLPALLCLLAARVFGIGAGIAAGLAAALSPMLGYHTVLVTPDGLSALLAVLAITLLWFDRRRLAWGLLGAGALVGLATWLRPNFVLLMPLLVALLPLALGRPRRTLARGALGAALALLVVAPITIRNYRIYGEAVPVSINMGIVLWEGIADAGGERFGARPRDFQVAQAEATQFRDPRYARWWASPDGILRDRDRVRRSLGVIRENPAFYARSLLARTATILDQEHALAPLLRTEPSDPGPARVARLAEPGRPILRPLQRLVAGAAVPLCLLGLAAAACLSLRRTAFVLLLPVAVVLMQAPVHFEPRYALPAYAFYPVFEGVGWALLFGVLLGGARRWRRARVRPAAVQGPSVRPGAGSRADSIPSSSRPAPERDS
jgi:hypothetical protein